MRRVLWPVWARFKKQTESVVRNIKKDIPVYQINTSTQPKKLFTTQHTGLQRNPLKYTYICINKLLDPKGGCTTKPDQLTMWPTGIPKALQFFAMVAQTPDYKLKS